MTQPTATQPVRPALAAIPARWGSTRFPGKALADRSGKPLIQHVWERVRQSRLVERLIIATDDQRIMDAAAGFGAEAVLTSAEHPNGTSRLNEAAEILALPDDLWICNVQGDEPEVDPAHIDLAIAHAQQTPDVAAGTLASPFAAGEDPTNPNIVKVVLDSAGCALYFSRSLIPYPRQAETALAAPLKHIGFYVYRRDFLRQYVALPPAPLEQIESLEQLRILENGRRLAVAVAEVHHHGIDTPEQYEAFLARRQDSSA
ncbi:MAG: 3-deoxy-manno-octulosonate cytidylyltransferase [Phycisphaerales bacterium JB038]